MQPTAIADASLRGHTQPLPTGTGGVSFGRVVDERRQNGVARASPAPASSMTASERAKPAPLKLEEAGEPSGQSPHRQDGGRSLLDNLDMDKDASMNRSSLPCPSVRPAAGEPASLLTRGNSADRLNLAAATKSASTNDSFLPLLAQRQPPEASPQRRIIEALRFQRSSDQGTTDTGSRISPSPRASPKTPNTPNKLRFSDQGQTSQGNLTITGYYNNCSTKAEGLDHHCLDHLPGHLAPFVFSKSGDQSPSSPVRTSPGPAASSADADEQPHRSGLSLDVDRHIASTPRPRPLRLNAEQLSSLPRLPQFSLPVPSSDDANNGSPARVSRSISPPAAVLYTTKDIRDAAAVAKPASTGGMEAPKSPTAPERKLTWEPSDLAQYAKLRAQPKAAAKQESQGAVSFGRRIAPVASAAAPAPATNSSAHSTHVVMENRISLKHYITGI